MRFDLQLFVERNLENQTSNQLCKGIRAFQKKIEEHLAKIENPGKLDEPDKQAGIIGH